MKKQTRLTWMNRVKCARNYRKPIKVTDQNNNFIGLMSAENIDKMLKTGKI